MHHRTLPDGTVLEVADVSHCVACGQLFTIGLMTKSWRQCTCTDGNRGHREFHCLRPGCRGVTDDPTCKGQYGPTGDYA